MKGGIPRNCCLAQWRSEVKEGSPTVSSSELTLNLLSMIHLSHYIYCLCSLILGYHGDSFQISVYV